MEFGFYVLYIPGRIVALLRLPVETVDACCCASSLDRS